MQVTFRIGGPLWLEEGCFEHLLATFGDYPGVADELVFFTSATHPPLSLEVLRPRLARLRDVMARTRSVLGVQAGINVLATIGHHEENLAGSLDEPWQRAMDPQGRVCLGSYCISDPRHQAYVEALYALVAKAAPDVVWVDDDVRLAGHMPVGLTCFCERCLAQFAEQTGELLGREELFDRLDSVHGKAALRLRRQWLAHNRAKVAGLLSRIERSAHSVRPELPLGFMTGDRFYEGYGFDEWEKALAGPEGREVHWRPGGGFYWDDAPLGLVDKAHDVGRQSAALPRSVENIQSEIENFPYHRLKKSVRATVVEAAAHLAAGATGTAFNVLSMQSEPLDEYRPFLAAVQAARPFFTELGGLGRAPALGVWPAWNRDLFVVDGWPGRWGQGLSAVEALRRQYVLAELGIPHCYGRDGAAMTTLSGATPLAFTCEELEDIFRGGVLLDVGAWQALEWLGLSHLTGVRVTGTVESDASERFTEHSINGALAGRQRDCRQSFWHQPASRIEPTADGVAVLATLVDYLDRELGPCLTVYENALGGRVAVAGYYAWFLLHNFAKSSQMKRLCRWLSRDSLPVVVDTFAKVVIWARGEPGAPPALVLLNASMDLLDEVVLSIRDGAERYVYSSLDGGSATLNSQPADGGSTDQRRLTLANVPPWGVSLLRPE
ncbi:MAG: hypothetical protein GX601_13270 [Anaerolineales bacterium]|nr:hypothetical protein [Anaerolineales bacterium]